MRVILLGPPGSGKGTQGDLLEKKYGFPKVSTGDLLRREVQEGTPLGKKAEVKMNRGELVSDDLAVAMIKKRIFASDCKEGYIIDGFPRNIAQAQKLEKIDKKDLEIVFDIRLRDQTVIERLSARRICSSCGAIYNLLLQSPKEDEACDMCGSKLIQRRDDTSEVIKERLIIYHEQTEPLVDYYKKKGVYYRIEGEEKIEIIFHNIYSILDRELTKSMEARLVR